MRGVVFQWLFVAVAMPAMAGDDVQQVYLRRCDPCHRRQKIDVEPSNYSQRGLWDVTMKMAERAKLDYFEQSEMLSYLESVRTGGAKLPAASPPATAVAPSTNEFGAARELYVARCASCHAHKLEPIKPDKFTEAKWKEWMQKMAPIAKLSPEQAGLVGRYLEAVRAGKAARPGPAPVKRN
jgi:cytochrome c5